MFLLFVGIIIVWCKSTCPSGYYGEDCEIYIPGTAHLTGSFEDEDCMDGIINLDGFEMVYRVPKSLIVVERTDCEEILTATARRAIFNNTIKPIECTWVDEDRTKSDFYERVFARGVIQNQDTFVRDREFPPPFPIRIVGERGKTVDVQLQWFDTSHVVPHKCAPILQPSVIAVAIVITLCLMFVVFVVVIFLVYLLRPVMGNILNDVMDRKDTGEHSQPNNFLGSSGGSSLESEEEEDSGEITEGGSTGEMTTTDGTSGSEKGEMDSLAGEEDDLGLYYKGEEEEEDIRDGELDDPIPMREKDIGVNDSRLKNLIRLDDDDDAEFSS